MSTHAYSCCWIHLIWSTYMREKMLPQEPRQRVSSYLTEYAHSQGIYMKVNFVNSDHVHVLIDLPTNMSIEETVKLLKGSFSHWINENRFLRGKFFWGREYGAFSVSHSLMSEVTQYIAKQYEHHKIRTFQEEYQRFINCYGLKWRDETVKTVGEDDRGSLEGPLDESRG